MTYNFDQCPDRRGTESVKWDLYPRTLPLWVADMDFKVAPEIQAALQKRLEHGVFGYELVPDSYFEAMHKWFAQRHGWDDIDRSNIVPTTGVIAAYSAAIKAMTVPGDKVMVMTPCYNAFFPAIRNNKCVQLDNPLKYDGHYIVDWDDFEKKAAEAKVLLLCNPHNPAGRVWTREELLLMARICRQHNVFVISDEIHCELTYPGHDYTPWATLPEEYVLNSVSCISPTKAFNLAGIQIANIYAKDPAVLSKMDRAINDNECCDVNVFGVTALKAAYTAGGEWLDQLREYLYHNARTVSCFLEDELPAVNVLPLEGTYLMWIDCRTALREGEPLEGFSERFGKFLQEKVQLTLSTGSIYGAAGEGFMRVNIACPRSRLLDGMQRFIVGFEAYKSTPWK
ncbi:MAG: pyridoxal phosphate-dependent aminotransferase [Bacteroidales bacterium]|nr:pyridoxal phosphate-dependent aminotransferase [Bacteroidales bacterium]